MKTAALKEEQFLTDVNGKRTAIVLDLRTYRQLREAEEELADIQAYDSNCEQVHAEIAAGQYSKLANYRSGIPRKRK